MAPQHTYTPLVYPYIKGWPEPYIYDKRCILK